LKDIYRLQSCCC